MAEDMNYDVFITALSEDDGGGFLASCLELRGCMGDGATREEALADLLEAMEVWADAQKERKKPMPKRGASYEAHQKKQRKLHELLKEQSDLIRKQSEQIIAMSEEIELLKAKTSAARVRSLAGQVFAGGYGGEWILEAPPTAKMHVLRR